MKTLKTLIIAAMCMSAVLSDIVSAKPLETTTLLVISPNPVILSGDSTTDVKFTTTTGTPTYAGTPVTEGKVQLEWASDGSNNPVPAGSVVEWIGFGTQNNVDASGMTEQYVDIDSLFSAGTTVGIRAHYKPEGGTYGENKSVAIDLVVLESCSGSLTIAADLAGGVGTPAPGYEGCWTFRITLTNCTGNDLTGVKVQGGTNGWTNFSGYDESTGDVSVKYNKKNEVLTWILDIENGATETLLVTVCGRIKPSTPDGTVLFLSGAWSAVYDDDADPATPAVKTEYTGRVSITVTEPIL